MSDTENQHYTFRWLCVIMGPWRIAWLILAAALTSMYMGSSVAPFAGYVNSCTWGVFLFGGAAFVVLSIFTLICYILVAPFPAFFPLVQCPLRSNQRIFVVKHTPKVCPGGLH